MNVSSKCLNYCYRSYRTAFANDEKKTSQSKNCTNILFRCPYGCTEEVIWKYNIAHHLKVFHSITNNRLSELVTKGMEQIINPDTGFDIHELFQEIKKIHVQSYEILKSIQDEKVDVIQRQSTRASSSRGKGVKRKLEEVTGGATSPFEEPTRRMSGRIVKKARGAAEDAPTEVTYSDEPMPTGDMDDEDYVLGR